MTARSAPALLCLILLAAGAAAAPSGKQGDAQPQDPQKEAADKKFVAGFIMNQVMVPTTRLVSGLADSMADYNAGHSWAMWDLVNALKKQREAGEPPAPDPRALEAAIRLLTRCNAGHLNGKALPDDAAYAAAAAAAAKSIAAYAAHADRGDLLGRFHMKAIEKLELDAQNAMVRKLPPGRSKTSWDQNGDPIPMTALEQDYLARAEAGGQPRRRKLPPWPGGPALH